MSRTRPRGRHTFQEKFVWWTNQARILLVLGIPVFAALNSPYIGVVPGAQR